MVRAKKPNWGFTPDYSRPPSLAPANPTKRTRKRLSPNEARHKVVLQLADGTRTVADIAAHLEIQPIAVSRSIVALRHKGHRPSLKDRAPPPTQERNAEIVRAVEAGSTFAEVGERFRLSLSRIDQIVQHERKRKK